MSREANKLRSDISNLTQVLIQHNIATASRIAEIKVSGLLFDVCWDKQGTNIAPALKNMPYNSVYEILIDKQQYNFMLSDGSFMQLLYRFKDENLIAHRVCYFPAPKNFDDESRKKYDEIPQIRIDYSPTEVKPIFHSSTHMHLGFGNHSRIPTSGPVNPRTFVLFVLRSFYPEKLTLKLERLLSTTDKFAATIETNEEGCLHFRVPH